MSTTKKRGNPRGKRVLTNAAKQAKFLEVYAKSGGNITTAAEEAGINRHKHYQWLQEDLEYGEAFARATTEANDRIDREIFRRGHDGVLTPVWYQGKECGRIREYSDTLLIFFAKGRMPEKYRDNYKAEIDIKANTTHTVDLSRLNDEQFDALGAFYRAVTASGHADAPSLSNGVGAPEEEQNTEVLPG